jgi:hypothetical protein
MKIRFLIFIFFFLWFAESKSQDKDSAKSPLDSISSRLDSLKLPELKSHKANRLIQKTNAPSLDQLTNKSDSLKPQQKTDPHLRRLDSLQTKLTSRIDSLGSLQIKDTILTKQLAKLRSQLDSLKIPVPSKNIKQAQEKVAEADNKLIGKVKTAEGKVAEKMKGFSESGGNTPGGISLPGANLSNTIPAQGLSVPDTELPGGNIPDIANPLGDASASIPGIDGNLGDVTKLPDTQVGDIKELGSLGKAGEQLGEVNKLDDQVKGYQGDLKGLQKGDLALEKLPGDLESKAENLEPVKDLQEQAGDLAAIKKNWNDPEVMKEEALNKAKENAVNHFAGHEEELKAVMSQMSKLKVKVPDPEGALDLFAKRQQFMKQKPLIERFVPGLTFQIQKLQSVWLDLNPQVAFKITGRWLAGTGWNERLSYDFDDWDWTTKNRVYGSRSFVLFKLKESFWLKGDAECMNAPRHSSSNMSSEITGRRWVWSYFAGIKKDFQFSKTWKGNVQTLFNLYNPGNRSPYTNRFNIRLGFEWPIAKKKKVKESTSLE